MTFGAPPTLVEQLAAKTGLANIIASGVIRRACVRVGVAPEHLSHRDLPKVIEAMVPLIAVYLPPAEAAARAAELRRFGGPSDSAT